MSQQEIAAAIDTLEALKITTDRVIGGLYLAVQDLHGEVLPDALPIEELTPEVLAELGGIFDDIADRAEDPDKGYGFNEAVDLFAAEAPGYHRDTLGTYLIAQNNYNRAVLEERSDIIMGSALSYNQLHA